MQAQTASASKVSRGGWFAGLFSRKKLASTPPTPTARQLTGRAKSRGGTGVSVWGGHLQDDDQNADLRGSNWYGEPGVIGVASKMMRDGHIRRSFSALTKPVRSAVWDVKAASSAAIDFEAADYVRWNFFEQLKWKEALRGAQYHLRDGFALLEVTDDVVSIPAGRFPLHPGQGKGIAITGFHQRPAWTLDRWYPSKTNSAQIDGIDQCLSGGDAEPLGRVFIPADRLLRFTYEQEGGNYAGLAALRSAYGAWKTKLTFLVLEAIRNEREAVGTPRLKLPEEAGEEEIALAQTILSEMRSHEKGYLILPHGFEFQWEVADTKGQADAIAAAIERCNRDIAYNVGAGFMLLGITGDSGSFALAQTQQGQYQIELDSEADFLADVFNHGSDGWSPIRRLIDLNYGVDVATPRIIARNMPTRDWSKIMPVIHNLLVSGGIRRDKPLRDHIREALILPPEDPSTIEPPGMPVQATVDEDEPMAEAA